MPQHIRQKAIAHLERCFVVDQNIAPEVMSLRAARRLAKVRKAQQGKTR